MSEPLTVKGRKIKLVKSLPEEETAAAASAVFGPRGAFEQTTLLL